MLLSVDTAGGVFGSAGIRFQSVRAVGSVLRARINQKRNGADGGVVAADIVVIERLTADPRVIEARCVASKRGPADCGVRPPGRIGGKRRAAHARICAARGI